MVRSIPCGVASNAQAITSAIGNPIDHEHDDKAHHPVRNFEKWKNLGRDLNQQPTDNCVSDRNLVNVAPLQLGKEIILFAGGIETAFEIRLTQPMASGGPSLLAPIRRKAVAHDHRLDAGVAQHCVAG